MDKKAFTTLELIIVIAVIAILMSFMTPVFSNFYTRNAVQTKTAELVDTLGRARIQAMNGRFDEDWGVHFESDEFVLFRGSTYDSGDTNNEDHPMGSGYELSSITLNGGGDDIIFNKVDGDTEEYGSVTVQNTAATDTKTVSINAAGAINSQ